MKMLRNTWNRRLWAMAGAALLAASSVTFAGSYSRRDLVSDGSVPAEKTDAHLVNPWGIAFNPTGFSWVADNGTGVSTLYDGDGNANSLIVEIPGGKHDDGLGSPTGIVFYGGASFVVSNDSASGPSRFIFAVEDGQIAGWAPNVDRTHAILAVDNSELDAIYKGLAVSETEKGTFLYATDFRNARVDVFDGGFQRISTPEMFVDPRLPTGFAPFGINVIGDRVYVTYAMQDEDKEDDVTGPGLGYVSIFELNGEFVHRLVSGKRLNAPWGLALAPSDFGDFSDALLVGNFGDGQINAYDIATGKPLGRLRDAQERRIRIEGLWDIKFGNGINNQPKNTLFFSAGPDDEQGGLYGSLSPQD